MRGGVVGFHSCGLKGDGCGLKGDGCGLKGEFFLLSCSIGFYMIIMFFLFTDVPNYDVLNGSF